MELKSKEKEMNNVKNTKFYFLRFWTLLILPIYYLSIEFLRFYSMESASNLLMDNYLYPMIISMVVGYVNNYLFFSKYATLCVFLPPFFVYSINII